MSSNGIKNQIKEKLQALATGDLNEGAKSLFAILGYKSKRFLSNQAATEQEFLEVYKARSKDTAMRHEFLQAIKTLRVFLQIADEEITASTRNMNFDSGNINSFVFASVQLKKNSYPRGKYALFTREINKIFPMPVVILFKTADKHISISFIHRRLHKTDAKRDVLGSVLLIRGINPDKPHSAHLKILRELALEDRIQWMQKTGKSINFDGLLAAWLDTLDTEELNRRFYRDLFIWFQRAVQKATFPDEEKKTLSSEEHVIRLITRLMFIWFLKEKGLVAEDLFIEEQVKKLLKEYDPDAGDSYYRAILQNLFFATLNTEIKKRGFSKKKNTTHRNFSRYRYQEEMQDSKTLLDLFKKTPFINGGLFDCLDSEECTREGGYRIDCFSDYEKHRDLLSIPNRLFFGKHGLIDLFNSYKFTVEENTPIEQDVALDPELLGKVFENLLASYNPETRETARKQTGSYYTPRPVVDYMVDEVLIVSIIQKLYLDAEDKDFERERLQYLLDYATAYDDAQDLFTEKERFNIVQAIAEIKILDPAVGSGAFPMSILHKLTLALSRLDPINKYWKKVQKKIAMQRASEAFDAEDQQHREEALMEINNVFEKYRTSDFGRKLFLIQNSIFGVDIQPIACQIAKLRFFISLAIEQEVSDDEEENYGIKPLPNLETRFISANTLIALYQDQLSLGQEHPDIRELEKKLNANRENHFHATARKDKLACIRKEKELRKDLSKKLQEIGYPTTTANKISQWDPYDQNARADWFDAGKMFGVQNGFDVVIGNPPYIQLQKDGGKLNAIYEKQKYKSFSRRGDIYQLFFEKGCQILKPQNGALSYITSNSWLKAEYGKMTRRYFTEQHTPLRLLEMGKDIFENTIVDTCILILRHGKNNEIAKTVDMDRLPNKNFPPNEHQWGTLHTQGDKPWLSLSDEENHIMKKMSETGTSLKYLQEWDIKIYIGILTGYNNAFIIDDSTRRKLITEDQNSEKIIKPVLRGRDILRYQAKWNNLYIIIAKFDSHRFLHEEYPAIFKHLKSFEEKLKARGQCRYTRSSKEGTQGYPGQHHWLELDNNPKDNYIKEFSKEKLLWIELVENGRFAYDSSGIYGEVTTFMMTGKYIKYLCAILNARLIYWFLKQTAPTSGMGILRWKKVYVEKIPIPKISVTEQRPFVHLVDKILSAKDSDPAADTSELEAKIDELVYELYGLNKKEIALVEKQENR